MRKVVFRLSPHPCKIKRCSLKIRNGRCSLGVNHFVIVNGEVDYSQCLNYKEKKEVI